MKEKLVKKLNEVLFKSLLDNPALKEASKSVLPVKMNVTADQLADVMAMFYNIAECDEMFALCGDINTVSKDPYSALSFTSEKFLSRLAIDITVVREFNSLMVSTRLDNRLSTMVLHGKESEATALKEVFEILSENDKSACLVGGCIRDILIGNAPKDFDFVTGTPYKDLIEPFEKAGFTVKEQGKQFLVLAVTKNEVQFEIANFRKDSATSDGRRPDFVEVSDIFDDAARRDFTINSLFFNLSSKQLLDPTGLGLDDIDARVVRFNGKPEQRLREDYLRGIRFYRFTTKGFEPEPNSLSAVRRMFPEIVAKTDPERVRTELERMIGM